MDLSGVSPGQYNDNFYYDASDFEDDHSSDRHECDISIAWRNLRYQSGGFFAQKKVILRRLNGHFRYHSLNALMGPSGAGKTTLLNCLTGNLHYGLTSRSEIYLNKSERSLMSYFVQQHVHESIVGRLTVGETLRYAYRFKNGTQMRDKHRSMQQYIEDTVNELMLNPAVLSRHFADCSGGEQKRIAIAQELMSLQKPSLLLVDEPTTGLDSNAALLVMSCLKQLTVHYRITVITSVHLPSHEILSLFDKLYVMAKGGVCIYSGPPAKLPIYLQEEVCMQLARDQQPIEALLHIACNGLDDSNVVKLADQTLSAEYHQIERELSQLNRQPYGLPNKRHPFSVDHLFLQLCRLMKILFWCDGRIMLAQVLIYTGYFVMLSTVFDHSMVHPDGCYTLDEENGNCTNNELDKVDSLLNENINYLGFSLLLIVFMPMCTGAVTFAPLVMVFRNEHRNKWYSMGVFYWSANIVALLQMSVIALVVSLLVYFLPEQHAIDQWTVHWSRVAHFGFIIWLVSLYVQSIGLLLGVVFVDQIEITVAMSQVVTAFMSLLNGFYFNTDHSSNVYIVQFANVIALKYIHKCLLFVFYGLDRCDPKKQFSLVLAEHNVQSDLFPYYVARVLYNTIAIRVATLLFMYIRFNTFTFSCTRTRTTSSQLIPIDHKPKTCVVDLTCQSSDNHIGVLKEEPRIRTIQESFSGKISIAWRNVTLFSSSTMYELGSDNSNRPILRNLNGQFCFGTMNALMGTSGAGKTTLLKVLNGRYKTRLNEQSCFYLSKFTKIETCFITQEVSGHLWTGLTAKQMLIYASRLKNRWQQRCNEMVDHEKIALNLLDELDMSDTANTMSENCSGGERKRLALALELTSLQMPNLICIDEPTSGLDSNSSQIVMSCLVKLAHKHGLTIVASIHQPNSELLSLFDQLYVLARGGVCVFSGAPTAITTHLQSVPQIHSQECTYSIELLVKCSCRGHLDPVVQQLVVGNDQQFRQNCKQSILLDKQTHLTPDGVIQNRTRFSIASSYVLTLRYLSYIYGHLWRDWLVYVAIFAAYSYVLTLFFEPQIALPSGCVDLEEDFNNTCGRTAEKIEEDEQLKKNFKYNFFMYNIFIFLILLQSSLNFRKEVVYFYNEHRNGWYSSGSFYLMKCVVESVTAIPIIWGHVYLCNIYEQVRPGIYWKLATLLTLSSFGFQGLAHIFCLVSNGNLTILSMLSAGMFLLQVLLGNLYVNLSRLHYLYRAQSNLSVCRHVFEAALLLQYGFHRCAHKQVQKFLYFLELQEQDLARCVYMLLFNLLMYRLIALSLLVAKSNPVQNRRQRSERIVTFQRDLQTNKAIVAGLSCDHRFRIKQTSA